MIEVIKREALRYYLDCIVTLCPSRAKKWTLSELHNITFTFLHYSGGHPVPRAESLYDGSRYTNVKLYTSPGFFSPLFPFYFFQTIKPQVLSDLGPVKDAD